MMRFTRVEQRSHLSCQAAFTFIAPLGFGHPKTCAHVRLLGPCFKTGRIKPFGRQQPWCKVCVDCTPFSPANAHCTQWAPTDYERATGRQPCQWQSCTARLCQHMHWSTEVYNNTQRTECLPSIGPYSARLAVVDTLLREVRRAQG